jgi:hypothetical protein
MIEVISYLQKPNEFQDKNIDSDYVIICDEKYFTFNPHYIASKLQTVMLKL